MDNLPYLYAAAIALSAALAVLAVWARKRFAVRAGAVALLALLLALDYAALVDLLSRPKPIALERLRGATEQAQVLAANLAEGEAIYLWLRLDNVREPRYYALPWERETASELEAAIREAEERRARLMMRLPFEPSLEDRAQPRFYALPQPQLPPKPLPSYEHYRHPDAYI